MTFYQCKYSVQLYYGFKISVLHKNILFEIRFHFQLLVSSESHCRTMREVCTHFANNKNLYFEFTIAIKNILNVMRMFIIIIVVSIIPLPGGAKTWRCAKVSTLIPYYIDRSCRQRENFHFSSNSFTVINVSFTFFQNWKSMVTVLKNNNRTHCFF